MQTHWYIVSLVVGVVVLIGAILNWNWLCDPTGKPSHRYGRGSRRGIFFLLGVVLIVVGIWGFVLTLR